MATDMKIWHRRAIEQMTRIADENFQRTVWFGGGGGRWVDTPTERICKFDDLSIPQILADPRNGLNENEKAHLARLSSMMDDLVEHTPDHIKPEELIDDPRWIEIRKQAAKTLEVLSSEL